MRFKRPKNGHYTKYCFGCRHYEFDRQVGCAYLGKCTAIEDEPTEQDAYDPPCGLWEKRADTPQTERKSCKLKLFDDDDVYIEPQTEDADCDKCIWSVCNYNKAFAFEDEPQTEEGKF